MNRMIFVNLPVADVERAKDFFAAIGFAANPVFSDASTACIVISDEICAMVMDHARFEEFSGKPVTDTASSREAIIALSAASRGEVDDLTDRALAAGATTARPAQDEGPMYGRSFLDPDGHLWEIVFMDMSAMP